MDGPSFLTLLSTFAQWPHSGHWPRKLCNMGFRYTGDGDTLECTQCKQRISGWLETGRTELERHKRTCGLSSNTNHQVNRTNHCRVEYDDSETRTNTHSSGTVNGGHSSLHNVFSEHNAAQSRISNGISPSSESRPRTSEQTRENCDRNHIIPNGIDIENGIGSHNSWTGPSHNSVIENGHTSLAALTPGNTLVPTVRSTIPGQTRPSNAASPAAQVDRMVIAGQTTPSNGYQSAICLPSDPASEPYNPRHPGYASTHARLQSFADWPADFHITGRQMAEAGFFSANTQDYVRCHYCHGGLHNWLPGDNPWIEHARWFPKCAFVKKVKGAAFIQGVKSGVMTTLSGDLQLTGACNITDPPNHAVSLPVVREPVVVPSSTAVKIQSAAAATTSETSVKGLLAQVEQERNEIAALNRELREAKYCQMCHEKEIDILFLPCTHLVTCHDCAPKASHCPKCGKLIQGTVKTYRS